MSVPSFQLTGRSFESFSDFIATAQRIGSPCELGSKAL
jgi:hypothetical protein